MADNENESTPENEPAHEAPPNTEPHREHHQCKAEIDALGGRVTELETALNTALTFRQDSTPTKKPWTHRFGRDS